MNYQAESFVGTNVFHKNIKTDKSVFAHNKEKYYILPQDTPVPFLVELGVQTPEGKIVNAKIGETLCTHEDSGRGKSEADLKKCCAGAVIKKGLAIQGSRNREVAYKKICIIQLFMVLLIVIACCFYSNIIFGIGGKQT